MLCLRVGHGGIISKRVSWVAVLDEHSQILSSVRVSLNRGKELAVSLSFRNGMNFGCFFFFFRITSLFSEVCVRQNFGNFQFWSHFPTTSFWSPFHIGSPFFHPTSVKSGGCSTPRQFQAQSIGNSTVPLRGSDQGKTCKMVIEMS